jgi:hypothetical protein
MEGSLVVGEASSRGDMTRVRVFVVAVFVVALSSVGASAGAAHNCNLPEETVDRVCDGYHDIAQYAVCKLTKKVC